MFWYNYIENANLGVARMVHVETLRIKLLKMELLAPRT